MFLLTLIATLDPVNGELFDMLYNDHYGKLYRIILNMVNNEEDAQDIIQDTYRKVYLKIKRFYDLDEDATIKLLVMYSKNTTLDFIRKKKRRIEASSIEYEENGTDKTYEIPDPAKLPEDILINKEFTANLASFIDQLEPQRFAILMKYSYGMSIKEIANALCTSETAVCSRINRAKLTLRKMMEDKYNEQDCRF